MKKPSDGAESAEDLREKIIGFGELSGRKSFYPELRERLSALEFLSRASVRRPVRSLAGGMSRPRAEGAGRRAPRRTPASGGCAGGSAGGCAFGAKQAAGFAVIDIGGYAPDTPAPDTPDTDTADRDPGGRRGRSRAPRARAAGGARFADGDPTGLGRG